MISVHYSHAAVKFAPFDITLEPCSEQDVTDTLLEYSYRRYKIPGHYKKDIGRVRFLVR